MMRSKKGCMDVVAVSLRRNGESWDSGRADGKENKQQVDLRNIQNKIERSWYLISYKRYKGQLDTCLS